MPIDFPDQPDTCATYGYSYDFFCVGDGITHTIDQNWRVMLDPSGATFYAPVSTVASVDSSEGPRGFQGLSGATGATGMTGVTGAVGPQGLTFDPTKTTDPKGIVFLPSNYTEFGAQGTTLSVSGQSTVMIDNNFLSVGKGKEQIVTTSTTTSGDASGNGQYIQIDLRNGNNFFVTLANNDFTTDICDGIKLVGVEKGSYASIILQRAQTDQRPVTFKSEFISTNGSQAYTTTNSNYATGLTYGLGKQQNDIDVFYVSCVNTSGTSTSDLLINHQRYHTGGA